MISEKRNNQRWDAQTVGYCYKILAKLGASGYEFLSSLHWPLVSIRTLRERSSAIRFLPGPQEQFMDVLGTKVGNSPVGALAVMSVDEMAIRFAILNCFNAEKITSFFSRKQISVDVAAKTLIGMECLALRKEKNADEAEACDDSPWPAASHLQVTMLRGAAWHWKQLIAYEFTGIPFLCNLVTYLHFCRR